MHPSDSFALSLSFLRVGSMRCVPVYGEPVTCGKFYLHAISAYVQDERVQLDALVRQNEVEVSGQGRPYYSGEVIYISFLSYMRVLICDCS